jgi:hypothetical protein
MALREGGPLPQNGRRPRSGRVSDRETDPEILSGDHIPNRFNLQQLYPDTGALNMVPLVAPFSSSEVLAAIRAMNKDSTPGPDGFNPSFYQAAWPTVRLCVMALLAEFLDGTTDLECLNRAFMALLPKRSDARTPASFRPICLQNCSMKLISKMLTTRLQRQISALIDMDQTCFLRGWSISVNFIYAMELV